MNVWMFADMFPQSHCYVTMPVTSRVKDTCSNLSLSIISEGRRNCSTFWSAQQRNATLRKHVAKYKHRQKLMLAFLEKFDSNETATVRKHVTNYIHVRKLILVFLRKFDNRGIKIARVNSIRVAKSINLLLFCMVSVALLTFLN